MPSLQTRLFFRIAVRGREIYLLKIVSLSIAFACLTLIAVFTMHEFGYDRFHRDHFQVLRMLEKNNDANYSGNRLSNNIPYEVFSKLKSLTADSMILARVKILNTVDIISAKATARNQKIHAADVSIASIFGFEMEDGSFNEFTGNPASAIISSTTSMQHFGTVYAKGKNIGINTDDDTLMFVVAGVYKDFPDNSHERFDIFIAYESPVIQSLHFNPLKSGVYGRLFPTGSSYLDTLESKLSRSGKVTYEFQQLSEVYFGPRVLGEDTRHGDYYSITILIAITVLILFLALASFINLTTLTLPHRSKEIAVKKLSGIGQRDLNLSFAVESFAIVMTSSILGLLLLGLADHFLEATLPIELISSVLRHITSVCLVWIVFFLVFGFAPLLMVLRFTRATPNRLLSTDTITFPQLKKTITFLQLGISIFLIVASMVIRRQINYSLLKEPGRNHDQIVYLSYPKDMTDEGLRSLREGWKKYHPNVIDVMASTQLPNEIKSKDINSPFYSMSVDPGYRDFFDVNMVQGNWFKANAGDTIIVVNERGLKIAGDRNSNIIGVFEDMAERFNQPEKPLKLNIARYYDFNILFVRILEVDIRRTVSFLSDYFESKGNKPPISFLDKKFERWLQYQDGLNALSGILAIVSGLLSCFAIYGLSMSIVRDKLKQIALHKLFGASTFKITKLLFLSFSHQALVALLIFGPLTYLILKELLRIFIYATPFRWADAVFPLLYCALVIFLLCGFQARSLNRQDLTSALRE